MRNFTSVFAWFVVCFGAGYGIMLYTTSPSFIGRDPAAIGSIYDFSTLRGDDLGLAMRKRLVSGIATFSDGEFRGLSLGHFRMANEEGKKLFACQAYQRVTLVFEGDGSASGGQRPQMEVEGPCQFSEDVGKINPLWMPVARITAAAPADGDYTYEGSELAFRYSNLAESWPRTWVLIGFRLSNEKSSFEVTREDLNQMLGHPVVISF